MLQITRRYLKPLHSNSPRRDCSICSDFLSFYKVIRCLQRWQVEKPWRFAFVMFNNFPRSPHALQTSHLCPFEITILPCKRWTKRVENRGSDIWSNKLNFTIQWTHAIKDVAFVVAFCRDWLKGLISIILHKTSASRALPSFVQDALKERQWEVDFN